MRPLLGSRVLLGSFLVLVLLVPAAAGGQPLRIADAPEEALGLARFRASVGEPVRPWIVELEAAPGFRLLRSPGERASGPALRRALVENARSAFALQDAVLGRFAAAGVPALLRVRDAVQPDGTPRRIVYRFHYLINGFVAYLPDSAVERVRALPGVRSVSEPAQGRFFLDNSVDYMLGADPVLANRRLDVYGAAEELDPLESGDPGFDPDHPEETDWTGADGFEGQGMYLAVVDSGLDYLHPMFGGSGALATTALPQVGGPLGAPPSADDNRKVVYFYNLGGALTLDDFGHGTHVAATAAGYLVDSTTTPGTPGTPGAPPGGVSLHGVAPQAKLLAYPVCDASSGCAGDIELAIEDAASPVSLTGVGDGGSIGTGIPKPVADVVNLSLGGGNSPEDSTSRVSNNAVLAGVTVVAAAGNDGPGAQTVSAPCVGTLVTCVAAVQDPGSIAGADVLAAASVPAETCAGDDACATPGPPAETGAASEANAAGPGPQGTKLFFMAGG
ncbi:MAG TPA: S8 family serine peptidase, partial [Thermoanaerobaculia bacterium]